jgi:hypothetical protein
MGEPANSAEAIRKAFEKIQEAKPSPLRLFQDDSEDAPVQHRNKLAILDQEDHDDLERWHDLHNDPNVTIVSERYMSNVKIGIRIITQYVERIVQSGDESSLADEIWPE